MHGQVDPVYTIETDFFINPKLKFQETDYSFTGLGFALGWVGKSGFALRTEFITKISSEKLTKFSSFSYLQLGGIINHGKRFQFPQLVGVGVGSFSIADIEAKGVKVGSRHGIRAFVTETFALSADFYLDYIMSQKVDGVKIDNGFISGISIGVDVCIVNKSELR